MALAPFNPTTLPRFTQIDPSKIEAEIKTLLDQNRVRLKELLANTEPYTWDNLMQKLESMNDELHKKWSPIAHLYAVKESEPLRAAFNTTQELLTEYHTEIAQNVDLFNAISSIAERDDFSSLTPAQQKIITNDIRDFKLAGIHLPADKKARLAELNLELNKLRTLFQENLLDATNAWMLHITDKSKLDGLPAQAMQLAIDSAKQRKLDGYVLTLDYPSFSTAIKYLKNRELRQKIYEAYSTRASDQGSDAGKWDNTQVMEDLMRLRCEQAELVGFKNFADLSLATKMAKDTDEVLGFLHDLVNRSKSFAQQELQEVATLAKEQDGIEKLEVWDIPYYSQQLQLSKFNFTQEDFRPYFPIDKVLQGMFNIVGKLYGIKIKEEKDIDVWHPHVKFFSVHDADNQFRAGFYIDLYARQNKRGGAWMDECQVRYMTENKTQYPIAYLTCNFMRPVNDKPALLTHEDVLTLFHEFGHCLHHMLTKVTLPSVSGINGVPWDAVEFPSQFMENYCWEKEALDLFAGHYETNKPFPDDLYQKMLESKHFLTGMQMIRQLEFSLFDFRLHLEYDPTKKTAQVQQVLNDVRKNVSVMPAPPFNRFQHSFSHIFGGGYSAGYYSYKWAEVLSSDAYSAFEETGLFNPETGKKFMENILEVGGVRNPMDSFVAFRGRKPKIDALLKHSGITGSEEMPK